MIYLLTLFTHLVSIVNAVDGDLLKIRGVSPENQHKYQPDVNGNWRCLNNPEILISFDKINDDYCDCPDGSDEPGTNACPNGKFYCENIGYKPSYIPNFKLDDGVCDYELCCDGTDEIDGHCENRCKELNEEDERYRKEFNDLINRGVVLKDEMLSKSKKIRTNLATEIDQLKKDIETIKLIEIPKLLAQKQEMSESDEFIINNFNLIESDLDILENKIKKIVNGLEDKISNSKSLESILQRLTENYNPNFNDPAVKLAAQEYLNFAASDEETGEMNHVASNVSHLLDNLLVDIRKDLNNMKSEVLVMNVNVEKKEYEQHQLQETASTSFTSNFLTVIKSGCKQLVHSLLGIESSSMVTPEDENEPINMDVSSIIEIDNTITKLNHRLEGMKKQLNHKQTQLNKEFGPDDIFRSMDRCLNNYINGYTYKLCPTNLLEQINKDGKGTRIGVFEGYKFNEETNKVNLIYKNGQRCWNGPSRQAVVEIVCGLKHEILQVTEPEKCAYNIKMSSPVGCFESDLL